MINTSFLRQWVHGKYPLPDLDDMSLFKPNLDHVIWLSINHKISYHEINGTPILGLENAWQSNRDYYHRAIDIALEFEPGMYLDNEDALEIRETLGDPPDVSHPIYIVTIDDGKKEEIVYVGKSSSNHSRFIGGHSTAIKLIDPQYNTHQKFVYLCQIMLYSTNDEYLPLEFLADKKLALELLDDVESMLIYEYKPAFNNKKTKSYKVKHEFALQVQKYNADSQAIKDDFIYPPL